LGGAGGASAFGVKAGDVFTRITAVSVLLWIVLCALTCYWYLPDKLDIQADPGSMSSGAGSSGAGGMGETDGMGLSEDLSSSVPAISNETPAATSENTQVPATVPPAALQLPPAANETPATAPKVEEPAAPAADPVAPAAEPATPAPASETPAGDGVPK
jgi:preprotein translocase subunit SecG